MNEWKLVASLILSFLIVVEVNRKQYSPFLSVGLVIIAMVFPLVALPIFLLLKFTHVSVASINNPRRKPLQSMATICSKCGEENNSASEACSSCGNSLKVS